jgi:NhaA family Na+:H+ antiporter
MIRDWVLPAQEFIHTQGVGSGILLAATVIAIAWANSPWWESYGNFWHTHVRVLAGPYGVDEDLQHWINDFFMAIFFFVVGLEIKRELVNGALSQVRRAALPAAAALGGMVVPALVYAGLNAGGPGGHGWGIPMATDIAFALGVLGLLGDRISHDVRVFLLALAIVDDIGAILVIAIFYAGEISLVALAAAGGLLALMILMRQIGVISLKPFAVLALLFWFAVFQSGVHATIAGVILGFLASPYARLDKKRYEKSLDALQHKYREALHSEGEEKSEAVLGQIEELTRETEAPLERLLRVWAPWASFVILPLFALANAGMPVTVELLRQSASSPVTLGIVAGLLLGKAVGIFAFAWLAVRLGLASLPESMQWRQLFGVAILAGIGFTVSIFISGLAFDDPRLIDEAKIGILIASLLAGLVGFLVLRRVTPEHAGSRQKASQ